MQGQEALLPFHGTYKGYQWHTRNKVIPCTACKDANAHYIAVRREKEKNNELRRDRRRDSAERYRQVGGSFGPRHDLDKAAIVAAFEGGESISSIARRIGADRRTVNKALGRGNMRSKI